MCLCESRIFVSGGTSRRVCHCPASNDLSADTSAHAGHCCAGDGGPERAAIERETADLVSACTGGGRAGRSFCRRVGPIARAGNFVIRVNPVLSAREAERTGFSVAAADLPANAECHRDHLGIGADGCCPATVGRSRDRGAEYIEEAGFGKQFCLALSIHTAKPVLKATADVVSALIARKVSDDCVLIGHAAIEVGAILCRLGVGKAGHFAIEATAAGYIDVVRALGE